MREVFYARNHRPVVAAQLQAEVAWLDKKISLAPCVQMVVSDWAPYELWAYLALDAPPPDFQPPHSAAVLVFREGSEVRVVGLCAAQTAFIQNLLRGETLARAADCDGLTPNALQQVMTEIFRAQLIEHLFT